MRERFHGGGVLWCVLIGCWFIRGRAGLLISSADYEMAGILHEKILR